VEFNRLKCSPLVLSTSVTSLIDDDDDVYTISGGQFLSHLVGEVLEIGLDETMLGSSYELKTFHQISRFFISKEECMTGQKG
jgi:hypothetical protein